MSESDWKVIKDALDMWRSTQVAIRGHVQTVSEAVDRLYDLRKRDSELILRLAKERNDARDLLHGLTNEADANAAWKALILRAEEAEVRVKELELEVEKAEAMRDIAYAAADAEHARVTELEAAIREFADTFPGDSHMWSSVQKFAKDLGT